MFLQQDATFLAYLDDHDIKVSIDNYEDAVVSLATKSYRQELQRWMGRIHASVDKKASVVELSFRATSSKNSALLLNKYIKFVSEQVKTTQVNKFSLFIKAAKQALLTSQRIVEEKAKNELASLLKKAEYAYQIATEANIVNYQSDFGQSDLLFPINLGTKALKAKIVVLKSITDVGFFKPLLVEKQITLNALNTLTLTDDASFVPFRYLNRVEPPLNRAAPKRARIVVLSTLLAGLLSISILLVRHFWITKKEEQE